MTYDEYILQSAYERNESVKDSEDTKIYMHYVDKVLQYQGGKKEVLNSFEHEDYADIKGLHEYGYILESEYDSRNAINNYKYMVKVHEKRI